jgi:hypothetical protein
MKNRITVRRGEKPLLVMDGTGDEEKLWLCDPNQKAFFAYSVENQLPKLTRFYQHQDQGWVFASIAPVLSWQPVTHLETIELLNEMENGLLLWMIAGGYAAAAIESSGAGK